ncbi:unnamed protein product [Amoebophrya sp. A120]|nr:unnamed protein product [Amoebophrya sp. A120]|eukprot:GSA120T00007398001.1
MVAEDSVVSDEEDALLDAKALNAQKQPVKTHAEASTQYETDPEPADAEPGGILNFDAMNPWKFYNRSKRILGWRLTALISITAITLRGAAYAMTYRCFDFGMRFYGIDGPRTQIYHNILSGVFMFQPLWGIMSESLPFVHRKLPFCLFSSVIAISAIFYAAIRGNGLYEHDREKSSFKSPSESNQYLRESAIPVMVFVFALSAGFLQNAICGLFMDARYTDIIRKRPKCGPHVIMFSWTHNMIGQLLAIGLIGWMIERYGHFLPMYAIGGLCVVSLIPFLLGWLREGKDDGEDIFMEDAGRKGRLANNVGTSNQDEDRANAMTTGAVLPGDAVGTTYVPFRERRDEEAPGAYLQDHSATETAPEDQTGYSSAGGGARSSVAGELEEKSRIPNEIVFLSLYIVGVSVGMIVLSIAKLTPLNTCLISFLMSISAIGVAASVLTPVIAKVVVFFYFGTFFTFTIDGAVFYFMIDSKEQYPEGPGFSTMFVATWLPLFSNVMNLFGFWFYSSYMQNVRVYTLMYASSAIAMVCNLAGALQFSRVIPTPAMDQFLILMSAAVYEFTHVWFLMSFFALMSLLCPRRLEAVMFALLHSVTLMGFAQGRANGAVVLDFLSIHPRAEEGESAQFKNLWIAALIHSVMSFIPILLLPWLVPNIHLTTNMAQKDAVSGSVYRSFLGLETEFDGEGNVLGHGNNDEHQRGNNLYHSKSSTLMATTSPEDEEDGAAALPSPFAKNRKKK